MFGTIGEITNMENYKTYISANVDILKPYNAKFLVRFGQRWLPEHEACTPPEPARYILWCEEDVLSCGTNIRLSIIITFK